MTLGLSDDRSEREYRRQTVSRRARPRRCETRASLSFRYRRGRSRTTLAGLVSPVPGRESRFGYVRDAANREYCRRSVGALRLAPAPATESMESFAARCRRPACCYSRETGVSKRRLPRVVAATRILAAEQILAQTRVVQESPFRLRQNSMLAHSKVDRLCRSSECLRPTTMRLSAQCHRTVPPMDLRKKRVSSESV